MTGRFVNTSRENFLNSLDISCYSFIEVARRAEPLMADGGCLITLTYMGSNRVQPNYNVMGVAKAALESAVRYLANDLGPGGIRVNAISPGPMKTLAGAAIGGARKTYKTTEMNAPLRANATLEAVGGTAVYLCSDHGRLHHRRDHPRGWRVSCAGHDAAGKPLGLPAFTFDPYQGTMQTVLYDYPSVRQKQGSMVACRRIKRLPPSNRALSGAAPKDADL